MASPTVVIQPCPSQTTNEKIHTQIVNMLAKLPGIDERARLARRIFIKLNLGIPDGQIYKNRPVESTDPAVYEGLAIFLQGRTQAEILVGDGTDAMLPEEAARQRGHWAVAEKYGHQFVDLNRPPHSRFEVPHPRMFRWYEMASALKGVDLWISVAKMKSHHLCGVTLTMKNLFGLTSNQFYGSPRVPLHSAVRLPYLITDLAQVCTPAVGLIDGIIGANFWEWGGDPVSSEVLIAGDNLVATDAIGARFMGVNPQTRFGTPPFIRADNHLRLACEAGLGPVDLAEIDLIGNMPAERFPFSVPGAAEPEVAIQYAGKLAEIKRNAGVFFKDREHFVREYLDELIMMKDGEVFFHEKMDEAVGGRLWEALDARKLTWNDIFFKLVQAEEAELTEPYGLNS